MTETDRTEWDQDYSSLGLVANPFFTSRRREGEPPGVALEMQAAANSIIAALVAASNTTGSRSIWIEKSRAIPDYYHLAAVAQAEKRLINDDELGIIHGYVKLYMLKLGRIRSALQILAERVAMREFDLTLAAWVAEILAEPDPELRTYELAAPFLNDFAAAFELDRRAALASVFGECELERDAKALEIADFRIAAQEKDIEEEEDTTPEADENDEGLPPQAEPVELEGREAALIDYIVQYTKIHLSPVIGRAIRVYALRGTASLGSEISITRAPRKTYKKLCLFAAKRFDRIALIYDTFANWHTVPDELRDRFVTALTELKLAMKTNGTLVFLAATDEVPEIEEQFGGGIRIMWDFAGVPLLEENPDILDEKMIRTWVAAAAIEPDAVDRVMETLNSAFSSANGSLETFIEEAASLLEGSARSAAETK